MAYSVSLAHLSDLHFGDQSRFRRKDPADLGRECAQAIKDEMKAAFEREKPDLVVVTGDITQQAAKEEFALAGKFFSSLQIALDIERSDFVFLPGNHDVSREACSEYFKLNPDKRMEAEMYEPSLEDNKLKLFNNFKLNFYGKDLREAKKLERGAAIYVKESNRLCIAALNSCEQETDEKHQGAISQEQAQGVMNALGGNYTDHIKILALHHAINSDADKAGRWLEYLKDKCKKSEMSQELLDRFRNWALSVNGNRFVRAIVEDRNVHLVLHGHQHSLDNPHPHKWQDVSEYCQICPAGSFGLTPDKLPVDQPNCLRLFHVHEHNNRLQLKTVSLRYDPNERLKGIVARGRFLKIGGEFTADFPLPSKIRFWPSPTDVTVSFEGKKDSDQEPHEYVRKWIEMILQADPDFCADLAELLKEYDDPASLAKALDERGFVKVWQRVVGSLWKMQKHLKKLERVLLLLAQGEVKIEKISKIRNQMKLNNEINVFNLPARYPLMVELILKTAIETEICVNRIEKTGRYSVTGRNMIDINKLEPGIDHTCARDRVEEEACKKFPNLASFSKEERVQRLKDSLKAYFLSNDPFFIVHSLGDQLELPYLVEFLLPLPKEHVPPDSVTSVPEDTLCELINIILTKISEFQSRGAL